MQLFAEPLSQPAHTCTPADGGLPRRARGRLRADASSSPSAGPQASSNWDTPLPTPRDLEVSATFDGTVRCVADGLLCPRYNIVFILGNGGLFLKTFQLMTSCLKLWQHPLLRAQAGPGLVAVSSSGALAHRPLPSGTRPAHANKEDRAPQGSPRGNPAAPGTDCRGQRAHEEPWLATCWRGALGNSSHRPMGGAVRTEWSQGAALSPAPPAGSVSAFSAPSSSTTPTPGDCINSLHPTLSDWPGAVTHLYRRGDWGRGRVRWFAPAPSRSAVMPGPEQPAHCAPSTRVEYVCITCTPPPPTSPVSPNSPSVQPTGCGADAPSSFLTAACLAHL